MAESIDLEHTCGYITLLNIGKPGRSSFDELGSTFNNLVISSSVSSSDAKEDKVPSLVDLDFSLHDNNNQHSHKDELDAPHNGIKNRACAEMLSNELDSLQNRLPQDNNNLDRDNLTLNIIPPTEQDEDEGSVADQEDTWLLLDCFFGIPLFESELNQKVCEKVASGKLCSSDR